MGAVLEIEVRTNIKTVGGTRLHGTPRRLVHDPPISSSSFSFTIHDKVKETGMRLVELGGCARFGMDDGYMIGPPELVLRVLAEFKAGI